MICKTCGAILKDGIPQYNNKTAQRLKCINYHIKLDMDKLRK